MKAIWLKKAYGKKSLPAANAYLALGNLCLKQGHSEEAANYFSEALDIFEKINGPQHISLPPIMDSYAEALDKSNHQAEAKKLIARAKAIRG